MARVSSRATLADIAKQAGVSLATASRVMNNSAYPVSEAIRKRVLEAAETLQYVPNAHARALASAATSTVGVIVHDVSDPYFSEITRGILLQATSSNRLVTICNTYRDPEREESYISLLHSQGVQAIILTGSGFSDSEVEERISARLNHFIRDGGRVTLIARHYGAGNTLYIDNYGGGFAVGEALLGLGHLRIGVIGGPPLLTTTADRLEGFASALRDAKVPLRQDHMVYGDFSRDGGVAAAGRLLDTLGHGSLSAIFALNDAMAIGALYELRRRHIRVPEEVSLVGFDDIPVLSDVTPRLSTVRIPLFDIGLRAFQLAIEDESAAENREVVPAELCLRETVARCAGA